MYTAVIYERRLQKIDTKHPLFGIKYIGQAVRGASAIQNAIARWREEDLEAVKVDKELGLMFAIKEFGSGAFENTVLEERTCDRFEVAEWADEREKFHIAKNGGPLRDQHQKLEQTLNLTDGGKFGAVKWLKAQEAYRTICQYKFVAEYKEYMNNPALASKPWVPEKYKAPSGYNLGFRCVFVRTRGELVCGMTNSSDFVSVLNQLGFVWSPTEDANWIANKSATSKSQMDNAIANGQDTCGDYLSRYKLNETDTQKAARVSNTKATMATVESVKKRSQIATAQYEKDKLSGARDEQNEKRKLTWSKKQQAMIDLLPQNKRHDAQKKIERERRKTIHKKNVLDRLRNMKGWENAKAKDVPLARLQGVCF